MSGESRRTQKHVVARPRISEFCPVEASIHRRRISDTDFKRKDHSGPIDIRIVKHEEAPRLETVKGRHGVILVVGERVMMMKLTVEPGIPTPPHAHPHEQMSHLLQGEGTLYVGDEFRRITAGTSFLIPPGAPHNFDAAGDAPAVLIEAFSPPREDYMGRVSR